MPDSFTSGGTSGGSTPGLTQVGGGGSSFPGASNVHNVANMFTSGPQRRLEQSLAQISTLAKTDPAAAQQMLVGAWSQFLTDAQAFAGSNIMGRRIVEQAFLKTPALLQTVDALWNETGGATSSLKSLTKPQDKNGVPTRTADIFNDINQILYQVGLWKDVFNKKTNNTNPQPGENVDPNKPVTVDANGNPVPPSTTTPPGSGQPGTPGTPGSGGAGGAGGAGGGGGGAGGGGTTNETDWLKKYWPELLLTAGSIFGNIWGASQAGKAAETAAKLQSEAAERATELQRRTYNKAREDQYPWLERGTAAVYRLSDLVGLKPGPRYTPTREGIGPISLASMGGNTDTVQPPNTGYPNEGPPVDPNQLAAPDQRQLPNLDELAKKYRRPAVGVA